MILQHNQTWWRASSLSRKLTDLLLAVNHIYIKNKYHNVFYFTNKGSVHIEKNSTNKVQFTVILTTGKSTCPDALGYPRIRSNVSNTPLKVGLSLNASMRINILIFLPVAHCIKMYYLWLCILWRVSCIHNHLYIDIYIYENLTNWYTVDCTSWAAQRIRLCLHIHVGRWRWIWTGIRSCMNSSTIVCLQEFYISIRSNVYRMRVHYLSSCLCKQNKRIGKNGINKKLLIMIESIT